METPSTHISAQQCFYWNSLQLGDWSAIYFHKPSFQAVSDGVLWALVALPFVNCRYCVYFFYFCALDHTLGKAGRDLWRVSHPPSCPDQGQTEQVGISKDGEPKIPLDNLFQVWLSSQWKADFFSFKWTFLHFRLLRLPPVLSLHTTEKDLAPSSFLPLSGIYTLLQCSQLLSARDKLEGKKNIWNFSCFSLFRLHWFVLLLMEQFYITVLPADLRRWITIPPLLFHGIVAQTELTTEKRGRAPPLRGMRSSCAPLTRVTEHTNKRSPSFPSAQGRFWQQSNTCIHEFSNFLSE